NATYSESANTAREDLFALCQRLHRDDDLAALAGEYARDNADANGAYNAGCFYALAAQTAAANPRLSADERRARADGHAKLAVEQLDQAIERGFTDRAHLFKDRDLTALRDRPEFRAFLARVEKRFPGRTVTPADLLASYRDEFNGDMTRYVGTRTALTVAD